EFFKKYCFAKGQPVETTTGFIPAESVRKGHKVLALTEDDPTGTPVEAEVEEVFSDHAPVIELQARGQVIKPTAEHPIFERTKGWIPAGSFQPGDQFRSSDGQWVTVEKVVDNKEITDVYNFRIVDHHTYFIGGPHWGFSVWAHNSYGDFLQAAGMKDS